MEKSSIDRTRYFARNGTSYTVLALFHNLKLEIKKENEVCFTSNCELLVKSDVHHKYFLNPCTEELAICWLNFLSCYFRHPKVLIGEIHITVTKQNIPENVVFFRFSCLEDKGFF